MTQTISVSNPLGTERIEKLIVRFSIPSIISIVVNSLYNMVDQVFIGQSVGYLGNCYRTDFECVLFYCLYAKISIF